MAKLIELKEAAEKLGITPEALTEMVDQKKIFGYRDGASWKFKATELDRVASELSDGADDFGGTLNADEADTGTIQVDEDDDLIDVGELQLDDDNGDDADSILISEEELGRSDDSTSSTIIGQANDIAADSDINIAVEDVTPASEGGSDLSLATDSDIGIASDGDSDLGLATDDDLSLAPDAGGSDLTLAADSDIDVAAGASDVLSGDSDLLALDEGGTGAAVVSSESGIDLSLDDDAATGSAGSSLSLSGSDALSLDDSDLNLDGDSAAESGIAADSSIDLDLDDDDLLGSGMGSDITLGASDSGINLSNPSDSGISLEDVSDMGSGIDSSLELGDDAIELEADAADAGDGLQTDDEFMLTPVSGDGDLDEESDDSGSQVIALDSDEFDESSATMLVPDDDPLADGGLDAAPAVGAAAVGGAAAAAATVSAAAAEDADFSVWNIVSLVIVALFMCICGLLALDVARNVWTWNEPFSITTSLMNMLTG